MMRVVAVVLAALLSTTARGASFPAEVFFRDAEIRDTVLSPSGKRLAITMAKEGSRYGLYVYEFGERPRLHRAALFREVDIRSPRWLNDDRLLYSTADLNDGSGWYPGKAGPGLFAVNHDGSLPRELIERGGSDGRAGREANLLQQKVLGPNHALLAVPQGRGDGSTDEILVVDRVNQRDNGGANALPLWLDVRTGRTRRVDWPVPDGAAAWLVDARGDARVVTVRDGSALRVLWRAPGQNDWQALTQGSLMGLPFAPVAIDENGVLYVQHRNGPEGYTVLNRFDFSKARPSTSPLVSTPGFDFNGDLVQDASTGSVIGIRLRADAETTVWLSEPMKRFQQAVDERFPGQVNRIDCRRCGEPEMVAVIRSFSDRDPGQLHVFRGGAWQRVGAVHPGIDPRRMATVDFHRIQARDGLSLPVWVTRPAGSKTGEALPTVVLVHGGPWIRGREWNWSPMPQFLASRGYMVIEPEFRGSDGYGYRHYRAGWKQFGQRMQDDVADALLWARQQGLANDKACIAGASYGGYSALMGLVRHPSLYQCGIAWLAPTDLMLYVKGDWWVIDDLGDPVRDLNLPIKVGDPEKDAAMLREQSPIHLAEHIKAPLLLGYGESDRRVPLAHGQRLRSALQAQGRDPSYVVYTGEGHGFTALRNELDWAARVERFLAEHLAPP